MKFGSLKQHTCRCSLCWDICEEYSFREREMWHHSENSIDSYRNLTYKTKMAYEWASTICLSADFVIFLISLPIKIKRSWISLRIAHTMREKASKWFVSKIAFSNTCNMFSVYFQGGSSFASSLLVERLSLAFPYVSFITVDDVYIIGLRTLA